MGKHNADADKTIRKHTHARHNAHRDTQTAIKLLEKINSAE